MEKERQGKNLVIAILLVTVLCMSVAFAAFTNIQLQINGTANLPSDSKWEVKFTEAKTTQDSDIKIEPVKTDNTITYTIDLEEETTYQFTATITNSGSYDAKLKTLVFPTIPTALGTLVTHDVDGLTEGVTEIPAGDSVQATVTVTMGKISTDALLKAVQDNPSLTLTLIAEFEQA